MKSLLTGLVFFLVTLTATAGPRGVVVQSQSCSGTKCVAPMTTTVRNNAGQSVGTVTTNGNLSVVRESQGRYIGSVYQVGNQYVVRNEKGQQIYSIAVPR